MWVVAWGLGLASVWKDFGAKGGCGSDVVADRCGDAATARIGGSGGANDEIDIMQENMIMVTVRLARWGSNCGGDGGAVVMGIEAKDFGAGRGQVGGCDSDVTAARCGDAAAARIGGSGGAMM